MSSPKEVWRFQEGASDSFDIAYGASAGEDGSVFLAGGSWGQWEGQTAMGLYDFSVAKIDVDGNLLWAWQEGSEGDDFMLAAAAMGDGGVVAAGYFNGTWNGVVPSGNLDMAAVKLDSDGTVVWRWQSGTDADALFRACAATADGNVVIVGYTAGSLGVVYNDGWNDMLAVKLNVDSGDVIWTYQAGTSGTGGVYAYGVAARADGSVVLTGKSFGEFGESLVATDQLSDFAAVAIDEDGVELWRWQDGPGTGSNYFMACTALGDGSVILAGETEGDWTGTNQGLGDFAMVKLSEQGVEEWRYQDGTEFDDVWRGAATTINGSIVLAGATYGSWAGANEGADISDFAAMSVDESGLNLWSYQNGTDTWDSLFGVAVRPDGSILLAGYTSGAWAVPEETSVFADYAAVLLDVGALGEPPQETTPAPGATTSGPAAAATPAPEATTPQPSPEATVSTPAPVVHPSATELAPTPMPTTRAPTTTSVERSSTSSSASQLGPIIAGAVCGAALLVVLGVFLTCRRKKTRRDNVPGATTAVVTGTLPPPVGAPTQGAPPPPPPYTQRKQPVASQAPLPPPPAYKEPPAYSSTSH